MNFATKYSVQKTPPERNSGISMTEKAGYIPAKARIENMMLAGQRLVAHRAEMYDFTDFKQIDESFIDPTRSKNFDMADATQFALNIENNKKQADALKASQTAQEPSDKDLKIPEGYILVKDEKTPE